MIDFPDSRRDAKSSTLKSCRFVTMLCVAAMLMVLPLSGCRKPDSSPSQSKADLPIRQDENPSLDLDQPNDNSSLKIPRNTGINKELPRVHDPQSDGQSSVDRNPAKGESVTESDRPLQQTVELHPEAGRFNEDNLQKDHTLFVVAFDSIPRQTYFLSNYRHIMSPDQIEETCELIDSFESRFTELRKARAKILANASAGQDVATMLLNNRIDIVMVSREIRRHIYRDILTTEQQDSHMKEVEERRARRAQNAALKNSSGDNSSSPKNRAKSSTVPDSIPQNPQ